MALNFPDTPVLNDTFSTPDGRQWKYDGSKWIVEVTDPTIVAESPITYDDATSTVGINQSALSITISQVTNLTSTLSSKADVTDLDEKAPAVSAVVFPDPGSFEANPDTYVNKVIKSLNASNFTIDASAIPAGSRIDFIQTQATPITFAAAAGTTLNSKDGLLSTAGQFSAASVLVENSTTAYLIGDLA